MTHSASPINLLTWLDVEREFKKNTVHGTQFPSCVHGVRCYSDLVEIECQDNLSDVLTWLGAIFGSLFDAEARTIQLLIDEQLYPVEITTGSCKSVPNLTTLPLWTDVAYLRDDSNVRFPEPWSDGPKLIAFHSFKGGVGRTTALINYVAASLEAAGDKPVRILVIDADLEAPGITFWLDKTNPPTVSFTQLLEALHYPPSNTDSCLDFFAAELRKTSLDAGSALRELFILPSALSITGMMDLPIKPEHLARNPSDPWQLSEHLRTLGKKLGVDQIFIDLRAGLSELSSPLLFDPRIEHFFVTTVSPQSIKGLAHILERLYIFQKKMHSPETAKPTVIINMLTTYLRDLPVYSEAQEALGKAYPGSSDDVQSAGFELLECEFSSSLMSLRSLREAFDLSRRFSTLFPEALEWGKNAKSHTRTNSRTRSPQTKIDSSNLFTLCSQIQFAETSEIDEMLSTEPLRNLGKHYITDLPNATSVGAKGSGKTFSFLQLCRSRTWSGFLDKLDITHQQTTPDADIFPVLWSANFSGTKAQDVIDAARNQPLPVATNSGATPVMLQSEVTRLINIELSTTKQDWPAFWDKLVCTQLGIAGHSLSHLNDTLRSTNRKIVLLFDGIEDSFPDMQSTSARAAVKGLLELPNRISELRNRQFGAIVFVRTDYVQAAIQQNVAQYLARFSAFNLEWTPESFLRLSYWLCGKAKIISATTKGAEALTVNEILSELEQLWGKKLGKDDSKEARSALWVFSALSDLKGRFQARDLVRFLRFSAEIQTTRTSTIWTDRILAPDSMRQAIPKCSEEKVAEAAKEITILNKWKESLDQLSATVRRVPFDPSQLGLDRNDLEALQDLGIIYEDTDQKGNGERFYLPEIYRLGLKFDTSSTGRPRTLALLKRNLKKLPF